MSGGGDIRRRGFVSALRVGRGWGQVVSEA